MSHKLPHRIIRLATMVIVLAGFVLSPASSTAQSGWTNTGTGTGNGQYLGQRLGQAIKNDARSFLMQLGGALDNMPNPLRGLFGGGKNNRSSGGAGGGGGGGGEGVTVKDIPREQSEQRAKTVAEQTIADNVNTYTKRLNALNKLVQTPGAFDSRPAKVVKRAAEEAAGLEGVEDAKKRFTDIIDRSNGKVPFGAFWGESLQLQKEITEAGQFAVDEHLISGGFTNSRDQLTQEVIGGPLGSAEAKKLILGEIVASPSITAGGDSGSGRLSPILGDIHGQILGRFDQIFQRIGFSIGGGGSQPGQERFFQPGGMNRSNARGGSFGGGFNFNPQSLFSNTFGAVSGAFNGFLDNIFGTINTGLNSLLPQTDGNFFGNLLGGLFDDDYGGSTYGDGIGDPTLFPNTQTILATQFSVPGSKGLTDLVHPIFQPTGSANVLTQLVSCPDPSKPGPTECVLDDALRTAIVEGLTVRQALDQGLLKADGAFGFRSDGLEPSFREGYPYRSLVILRNFRIIPIGWELAAQYIKVHQSKTLGEVVAGFSADGPFKGLVDPNWVLTAPELFCRRAGPGPQLVIDQINDSGDPEIPPTRSIVRNQNYCGDEQTCLEKGPDGRCKYYGYCAGERRVWDLQGQTCEPVYNSCETFTSQNGEQASYLKNTLDYQGCTQKSTGCTAYALPVEERATNDPDPEQQWKSGRENQIYFNAQAGSCQPENVGCSEFLVVKKDGQLLPNNASRTGSPDPEEDGSVEDEVEILIASAQDSTKGNGSYARVGEGYTVESKFLNNQRLSCKPEEVGCDRYTPISSRDDLVVPAVVTPADACHAQCVGQDQYRQVATAFEASYSTTTGSDVTQSRELWKEDLTTQSRSGLVNNWTNHQVNGYDTLIARTEPGWIQSKIAGKNKTDSALSLYLEGPTQRTLPLELSRSGDYRLVVKARGGGWDRREHPTGTPGPDWLQSTILQARILQQGVEFGKQTTVVAESGREFFNSKDYAFDFFIPTRVQAGVPLTLELSTQYVGLQRSFRGGPSQQLAVPKFESGRSFNLLANQSEVSSSNNLQSAGYWIESLQYSTMPQNNTIVSQREGVVLIPAKAAQCSVEEVGCDEFTNVDEVARGGETKNYFSTVKFCKKPAKAGEPNNAALYLIEQDTGRTGYQITTHELVAEGTGSGAILNPIAGPPCVLMNADGLTCKRLSDSQATCDPATTPDCREFVGLDHQRYFRRFSQTVTISDECHPYRRTKLAHLSDDLQKTDCERTNGRWDNTAANPNQGCVYNILKSAVTQCSVRVAGCREYQASSAGNLRILLDERFDDTASEGRWGTAHVDATATTPEVSGTWIHTQQSELGKGRSMELKRSATQSLALNTEPKTLSIDLQPQRQYLLSFWARTNSASNQTRRFRVSIGDRLHNIFFGAMEGTTVNSSVWKEYRVGPLLLPWALDPNDNPFITLETAPDTGPTVLIDNIRIVAANQFLVSGSWLGGMDSICKITDSTLPAFTGGNLGDPSQKGCRAYSAEYAGGVANLKSFTNLCRSDRVGCQVAVNTRNSTSPSPRAPEGDEPPTTTVAGDGYAYVVDNKKHYCPRAEKGCTILGKVNQDSRTAEVKHTARVVINDPDRYEDSASATGMLCTEEQVGCTAYVGEKGLAVFKDPGTAICDYYIKEGETVPHWWKRRYSNADPFESCPTRQDKTIGSNGPVATPKQELVCEGTGDDRECFVKLSPEPVHWKKRYWAGACPRFASSCTELVDARSTISTPIVANDDFVQHFGALAAAAPPAAPANIVPARDGSPCPVGTKLIANDVIETGLPFRAKTGTEAFYSDQNRGHFYFTCALGESTETVRYGVTAAGIGGDSSGGCPGGTTPQEKNFPYTQSFIPGSNPSANVFVCQRPKTQDPAAVPPASATDQCPGTPDSWAAFTAATTQYRPLGDKCVVSNAKQAVQIEPNRLYVMELRGKGRIDAQLGSCLTPSGLQATDAYDFDSPDDSMNVTTLGTDNKKQAKLVVVTTKDGEPTQTEERVVTARFLLRPGESQEGSTLTRRCEFRFDVGATATDYVKSATIRPAGVYYALDKTLTSQGCNGIVDQDIGCVLMNKRTVVGSTQPKNLLSNDGFETITESLRAVRRWRTIDVGPKSKPATNGSVCPVGTRLSLVAVATNQEGAESELPPLDPLFDISVDIPHTEERYTNYFSFTCLPGIAGEEDRYGVRSFASSWCPEGTATRTRTFTGTDANGFQVSDGVPVCALVGDNVEIETAMIPADWLPKDDATAYRNSTEGFGKWFAKDVSQAVPHLPPGYYRLEAFGTAPTTGETTAQIDCGTSTVVKEESKSGSYREVLRASYLTSGTSGEYASGQTLGKKGGVKLEHGTRAKFFYTFQIVADQPIACTVRVASPTMIDNVSLIFSTHEFHEGLSELKYDANRSGLENNTGGGNKTALGCSAWDQTTHVCQTNANLLLQAKPDRQCGQWLACRSALQSKDAQGNSENLCFDVGSCTQLGPNGECANFNVQEQKPEVYPIASSALVRDHSGFTKAGVEWEDLTPVTAVSSVAASAPPSDASACPKGTHLALRRAFSSPPFPDRRIEESRHVIGGSLARYFTCAAGEESGAYRYGWKPMEVATSAQCAAGATIEERTFEPIIPGGLANLSIGVCRYPKVQVDRKTYEGYGWYPIAKMNQSGNVVNIPNSGFEEVAGTGQPRSWNTEDPQNPNSLFFAPAWSRGIFEAINNPLASQKEGVQPYDGFSFLALRGDNHAVTSLIPAFGNTQYVISAVLNTSGLKRPNEDVSEAEEPSASVRVIVDQFTDTQELLYPPTDSNTAHVKCIQTSGTGSFNPKPDSLRITYGLDWTELNHTFFTCRNTAYMQLKIVPLVSSAVLAKDRLAKPEGSVYADNVQMTPILSVAPETQVTRSCRLYPTADAPSCRFSNLSGVRFKGFEGYCLTRDPNNRNACLQWYPVDVISGDERGELESSYRGPAPLYYCTEMKIVETRAPGPLLASYGKQYSDWGPARIIKGVLAIVAAVNAPTLGGAIANVVGLFNYSGAEGYDFTHNNCLKDDGYVPTVEVDKERKGFSRCWTDCETDTWTFCNATGEVLFESRDEAGNLQKWYEYNGTQLSVAEASGAGRRKTFTSAAFTEDIKSVCTKITKTVKADGENSAWSGRLQEGGIKFVPELGYTYASDSEPFGAVVAPDSGDSDNPTSWSLDFPLPVIDDKSSARAGSPYACTNDTAHGAPVCQVASLHGIKLATNTGSQPYPNGGLEQCSDAGRRLKHLFTREYGTWEWGGTCREAVKICKNYLKDYGARTLCKIDADCEEPTNKESCLQKFSCTTISACATRFDEIARCLKTAQDNNTLSEQSLTTCNIPDAEADCKLRVVAGSCIPDNSGTCQPTASGGTVYQCNGGAKDQRPCIPSLNSKDCEGPLNVCNGGIKAGQECNPGNKGKDCKGTGEKEGYIPLATVNQCNVEYACKGGDRNSLPCTAPDIIPAVTCPGGDAVCERRVWGLPTRQCPNNKRPNINFAYCSQANDFYTAAPANAGKPFVGICVGGPRNGKPCVTRDPANPRNPAPLDMGCPSGVSPQEKDRLENFRDDKGKYSYSGFLMSSITGAVPGGTEIQYGVDIEAEYCAVAPVVRDTRLNTENVYNSGFVNLRFTSEIDVNQLPMTAYKVDWGDGESATLSGVEIHDRPNLENGHSLFHLYSYWDIIQKIGTKKISSVSVSALGAGNPHCSADGEFCEVTIKIQIRDKWGWCNGNDLKKGFRGNDCALDTCKPIDVNCPWKAVTQHLKVWRERTAPPSATQPGAVVPTAPALSGASCPDGTHLAILKTESPAPPPEQDRLNALMAKWHMGATDLSFTPCWFDCTNPNTSDTIPDTSPGGSNLATVVGTVIPYNDGPLVGRLFTSPNAKLTTLVNVNEAAGSPGSTFEVELYRINTPPNGAIVSTTSATESSAWSLSIESSNWHIATGTRDVDTGVVARANERVFVVFNPTGPTDAKIRFYVNGRLRFKTPIINSAPITDDSPVIIGNNHLGNKAFSGGVIRLVSIYSRALTDVEIALPFPPTANATIRRWTDAYPSDQTAYYFICKPTDETGTKRYGLVPEESRVCPAPSTKVDKSVINETTSAGVTVPVCEYAKSP